MENLVTLTLNGTHFYMVDCAGGRLLIDAGWDLALFKARMKAVKVSMSEIRFIMFTHHHPDHAGLVQAVKEQSGARLIIHPKQIPYLDQLRIYLQKMGGYPTVKVEKDDLVAPSREVLRSIGVRGEIVETPGHSDDSISLVLDSGMAFTGDLPAPDFTSPESCPVVSASWSALLARGASTFYPSHAAPIPAAQIQTSLLSA